MAGGSDRAIDSRAIENNLRLSPRARRVRLYVGSRATDQGCERRVRRSIAATGGTHQGVPHCILQGSGRLAAAQIDFVDAHRANCPGTRREAEEPYGTSQNSGQYFGRMAC